MIPITFVPLDKPKIDALRKWLNDPAFQIAVEVLRARIAEYAIRAGEQAVEALTDDAQEPVSKASAQQAKHARGLLALLQAMQRGYYESEDQQFQYLRATFGDYGDTNHDGDGGEN